MSRQGDRWDTLWLAKEVRDTGGWVTFDVETTSLEGHIIEWAVCDPDGKVLGKGRVRPMSRDREGKLNPVLVTEGAYAKHGISDEMLTGEPTFDRVAPQIFDLLKGKIIVGYNVSFDLNRFYTSLSPYIDWRDKDANPLWEIENQLLYHTSTHCAMDWFAVIYGAWHSYFKSYTWQKLETACSYFDIQQDHAHSAASDARATAMLVHKLAELAGEELPTGYHPPRREECAGGCGQTLGPFAYDEDKTWYCAGCGLKAGRYFLCPRCDGKGERTIVVSYKSTKEFLPPGTLCTSCEYEVNVANGTWHICPRCTAVAKTTLEEQKYCNPCVRAIEKEKEKRREYQREYRARKRGRGPVIEAIKKYAIEYFAEQGHKDIKIISVQIREEYYYSATIRYEVDLDLGPELITTQYFAGVLDNDSREIVVHWLGTGRFTTDKIPAEYLEPPF